MPHDFPAHLAAAHPNLKWGVNAHVEARAVTDWRYNCVGLAIGDTQRWWDHTEVCIEIDDGIERRSWWLEGIPRNRSLMTYARFFETLGYVPCGTDTSPVRLHDKVAIFGRHDDTRGIDLFEHAALQPSDRGGLWYSKLGDSVRIRHELDALRGGDYGQVLACLTITRSALPERDRRIARLGREARPRSFGR